MKTIALAFLSSMSFLNAQVADHPAKNEFSMVIEGEKCLIKAYKPATPIIIEPLINKESIPKSPLLIAIMLTHSDISSYMSDEELFKFTGAKLDHEAAEQQRSKMRKWVESTGPAAEDNPWKGMKYVIEQAFVVESEKGVFLIYQLSPQGGKDISGKLSGSIKNVAGAWMIGGEKGDEGKNFQGSMVQLVPAEFAELSDKSPIEPLPLEDLLK
jgi:hypothetical protein